MVSIVTGIGAGFIVAVKMASAALAIVLSRVVL